MAFAGAGAGAVAPAWWILKEFGCFVCASAHFLTFSGRLLWDSAQSNTNTSTI
jgi:hypothetical protein